MAGTAKPMPGRLVGVRRSRAGLLRSTALQAAFLAAVELPGGAHRLAAQPAPNARPQGGSVVAGQATISQSRSTTTIDQSSQRAAIDWTSFNVGSKQTVDFEQPSSSAWTLNRVNSADPSQIAGHIDANGNIVLTNPAGVVFYRGSEVNAASAVISAPGITNRNFMAGRMVFDQLPRPNARIVNAGSITIKEAGLAALVAPQVRNSGVISAKLGHVVLAGATAHTLDMYGDGLLSFDVTGQVRQVPRGPNGQPATALVTNTGTVVADGGTVQLSARAADGIVQNLVDARGRIAADTAGRESGGSIEIVGTGGSVKVAGALSAIGAAPSARGGQIEVDATRNVVLANQALVDASGGAGGGTVALGTTLARAKGGPSVKSTRTARRTIVQQGATVSADATAKGSGGRITLLSTEDTSVGGSITARGGPKGGHGGTVEISSKGALDLPGSIDVSAPHGALGNIILDPTDLTITTGTSNATLLDNTDPNLAFGSGPANATITPAQIEALHGNVHLEATNSIEVLAATTLTGANQSFTLESGGDLTILNSGLGSVPTMLSAPGNVVLIAASPNAPTRNPAGSINLVDSGIIGTNVTLTAGTGGISVNGFISAASTASFRTPGTTTIVAATVSGATIALATDALSLFSNGVLQANSGLVSIAPDTAGRPILLTSSSVSPAGTLTVHQSDLAQIGAGTLEIGSPTAGPISVGQTGETIDMVGGNNSPPGSAFNFVILESGGAISEPGALVVHNTSGGTSVLEGSSAGATTLNSTGNTVDALGSFASAGDFAFTNGAPVPTNLLGLVSAGSGHTLTLTQDSLLFGAGGSLSAPSGTVILEPTTPGRSVDLGSAGASGTLDVLPANLAKITTGTLQIGSKNTGSVNIGDVTDGVPDTIDLVHLTNPIPTLDVESGANISEGGASIVLSVNTLTGNAKGSATFNATNTITTLGSFTASGGFVLNDTVPLTVGGPVVDPPNVTLTAPSLTIGALVSASGTVDLIATSGTISEVPPGGIVASALTGSGTGVTLSGLNTVGTLDAFAASGPFLFVNSGNLTIAGLVSGTAVVLDATGAITEATGASLSATTLSGSAASATLDQPNAVGTLGDFSATSGGFELSNFVPLSVSGSVSGTSVQLTTGGDLAVSGAIAAPSITLTANPFTDSITKPGSILQTSGSIGGPTNVVLIATGSIDQTGGVLTTANLSGSSGLTTNLPSTGNAVAALGSFSSTGGFTLTDGQALAVSGPVTDTASITIGSAGGIAASGNVTAPVIALTTTSGDISQTGGAIGGSSADALTLNAAGAITQSGGSIVVGSLGGSSGGATSLGSTTNQVTNLGPFASGGNFLLADAVPVTIAANVSSGAGSTLTIEDNSFALGASGALNATPTGTIVLEPFPNQAYGLAGSTAASPFTAQTLVIGSPTAGPITISNDVNLSGVTVLDVLSGASITEAAGTVLTVGTLEGSAGTTASFAATNSIATLAGFTATGGFTLVDAEGLTVTGPVNDPPGITLNISGPLTLLSALNAPTIDLIVTGSISEGPGGLINTGAGGTLTGSSGASVSLGNSNTIGTLATFSATGDFALNDVGNLVIDGLSGATVDLIDSGTITEAGVGIGANLLTGNATAATLDLRNLVATLGSFATTNGFALVNAETLAVAGPVTDSASIALTGAGELIVSGVLTAPTIDLTAPASIRPALPGNILQTGGSVAGANAVVLTAAGSIDQTGGVLTTANLSGSSGLTTNLPSTGNAVAALGSFSSTGGFTLADGQALAIAGPVTDTASITIGSAGGIAASGNVTAPVIALTTTSGDITQSAGSIAGSTSVTLNSAGAIGQTGGSIVTATLLGSSVGATDLASPTNQVTNLGPFTTGGNFLLADSVGVTIVAGVTSGAGATLTIADNSFTVGAAGVLDATPSGTIVLEPLTAGTPVALTGTAAALPFIANTLVLGSSTAGPITISNDVNLAQVATLDVLSAAAVGEASGTTLTVGALEGSAASANFAATSSTNSISTLGSFSTTGGFALTDSTGLTVAGPLTDTSAAGVSLNVTGSLAIGGPVSAPTVSLIASGAISEPGGPITAGTLSGSGASVSLTSPANAVATLGSFGANIGPFALTDSGNLVIAGGVFGATVDLVTTGAIRESSTGSISTPLLIGSAASATFDQTNFVATLGSFSATGGFALKDAEPLGAAGPVTGGTTIALTSIGPITVSGSIGAPTVDLTATSGIFDSSPVVGNIIQSAGNVAGTGAVVLTAAGSIDQTGGVLTTASLSGSSGLTTNLPSTGNMVAALGSFTSSGGFLLTDGESLAALGPVADSASIRLTIAGALALSGTLTAPDIVLNATGSITQPSGALVASGTLSGSAGSSATLGSSSNSVANLGGFTTGGNFLLADSVPVTFAAADLVGSGATLTVEDNAFTIGAAGSLAAPSGTIVLEPLAAGTPMTLSGTAAALPFAANTLVLGSSAAGPITISNDVNLSGVAALDVLSSAAVSEASSTVLSVGTLEGNARSGSFGATNSISTLGSFATSSGLTLDDTTALRVVGPVTDGSSITLGTAAGLTVAGNIAAPNLSLNARGGDLVQSAGSIAGTAGVVLTATGSIDQTGGALSAGTLSGSAGGAMSLNSTGNAVGVLGPFSSRNGFALTDGQALTVAGPVSDSTSISLNVSGALDIAGSLTAPTVGMIASAAISEPSGVVSAGTLDGAGASATLNGANVVATLGDFAAPGGFALTDARDLTVAGAVNGGASLALSVTGNLTLASGSLSSTSGMALNASGAITDPGSSISAGTLSGSASGLAQLGGASPSGTASVGTLAAFTVRAGTLALADATALTITGPISADDIGISATGSMVLDGGVITTLGLPLASQLGAQPAAPGSFLQVLPGTSGSAGFAQLGTTVIDPPNGVVPTLRIDLPASGSISLDDLIGPTTNLVLADPAGAITGNIDVASLHVLGVVGSSNLFGTVAGNSTPSAAAISFISPAINVNYLLNDCVIMSATCGGIPPLVAAENPELVIPATDQLVASNAAAAAASQILVFITRPLVAAVANECRAIGSLDTLTTDCMDLILPNISSRDY